MGRFRSLPTILRLPTHSAEMKPCVLTTEIAVQTSEVHAAIARAVEHDHTTDRIAHETGQRASWVRRHLRLGKLEPEVFRKYLKSRLSADQEQVHASTED